MTIENIGVVMVQTGDGNTTELRVDRDREQRQVVLTLIPGGGRLGVTITRMSELEVWTLIRQLELARRPLAADAEDRP